MTKRMKQVARRVKIVKWRDTQTARGIKTRLVEEKVRMSQPRGSPQGPPASASWDTPPMDIDMEYNFNDTLTGQSKASPKLFISISLC